MKTPTALVAILILVLGIVLALPSEMNIAHKLLESFEPPFCVDEESPSCQSIQSSKESIQIIGGFTIIFDLLYIFYAIKQGNFW